MDERWRRAVTESAKALTAGVQKSDHSRFFGCKNSGVCNFGCTSTTEYKCLCKCLPILIVAFQVESTAAVALDDLKKWKTSDAPAPLPATEVRALTAW